VSFVVLPLFLFPSSAQEQEKASGNPSGGAGGEYVCRDKSCYEQDKTYDAMSVQSLDQNDNYEPLCPGCGTAVALRDKDPGAAQTVNGKVRDALIHIQRSDTCNILHYNMTFFTLRYLRLYET
jgi:hypothetical protein